MKAFVICLAALPVACFSQFVEPLWVRSFDPVTFGPQTGPNNDANFSGGRGGMNLAFRGDQIAVVAEDLANPAQSYYLTLLDTETGETESVQRIRSDIGNSRSYRYPWAIVSAAGDNVPGLTRIGWSEDGTLFTAQGAYESAYTAYDVDAFSGEPGDAAVGAYAGLPPVRDPFGRTRADLWTTLGTGDRSKGMVPDVWGPSGTFCGYEVDPDARPVRYDLDWETIWGRQGSSYYNTYGRFSMMPTGPLIGLNKGANWSHNQAGNFYLFHKESGLKAMDETPKMPDNSGGAMLRPFSSGGILLTDERLFLIGPGEDRNGDGQLGVKRPEGVIPKVDQGLAIWAYDISMRDEETDPAGHSLEETAELSLAFAYDWPSRYEESDDLESYGQSWYETDGFYRPKPMVPDGNGVWVSWKPSMEAGVELVYADENETRTIDLGVGQGMKGVDLWPKLDLAETEKGRRLVYATPSSYFRRRGTPVNIDQFMSPFLVGRGNKVPYEELPEDDKQFIRQRIARGGAWSPRLSPPRGDAAIAVANPDSGELLWSDNLTERFRYLDPNGFWTYIDRSDMTILGDEAVFGFVNNGLGESRLTLAFYDLTASRFTEPRVMEIALAIDGTVYNGTALTDLAVHDGKLYALVTQGQQFTLRDPRWQAQHVIAVK